MLDNTHCGKGGRRAVSWRSCRGPRRDRPAAANAMAKLGFESSGSSAAAPPPSSKGHRLRGPVLHQQRRPRTRAARRLLLFDFNTPAARRSASWGPLAICSANTAFSSAEIT